MTSARHGASWQSSKRTVLEGIDYLCNETFMSDVSFVCGATSDRLFHAHKVILGTRSAVFQAMLYGELAEKEFPIRIPDADEDCFEQFLRFLYVDDCPITAENAIGLLYLAEKYDILALIEKCCKILEASIDHNNVFKVLKLARLVKERELEGKCWDLVSTKTTKCLNSKDFCNIDSRILDALLIKKRTCSDRELFKAVVKWADSKCAEQGLDVEEDKKMRRQVLGDSVYGIPFLAMSQDDIINCVSFTGILTNDEIVAILQRLSVQDHDVPGLKWKDPRVEPELVTINRFDPHDVVEDSWFYVKDKTNALSFTVNEAVRFLGVRLFGDHHGNKYSVKFTIKRTPHQTRGNCISQQDKDGVWGYDVMLLKPVPLQPDEEVTMTATIKGPESYKGSKGKPTVKVGDIVVHFHDAPSGAIKNHTSNTEGQFYKIFLRKL